MELPKRKKCLHELLDANLYPSETTSRENHVVPEKKQKKKTAMYLIIKIQTRTLEYYTEKWLQNIRWWRL